MPYDKLWIYELEGVINPPRPDSEAGLLGCWVEGESVFLFFDRPAREAVQELAGEAAVREEYRMSYLDWQGGQAVEPFQVGRLCFRPPWVLRPRHWEEKYELLLDPGLVFGSGNHPTTRDCLKGLLALADGSEGEDHILDGGVLDDRVLDLGCGTGVLSLAAARLGSDVVAADLNPLCCLTTARNLGLNKMEERVRVFEGDALELAGEPAGLVIANIQAEVIELFAHKGGLEDRKHLLLSGLTRSKVGRIRNLTKEAGFEPLCGWEDQATWFTYLLGRGQEGRGIF